MAGALGGPGPANHLGCTVDEARRRVAALDAGLRELEGDDLPGSYRIEVAAMRAKLDDLAAEAGIDLDS